MFIIAFSLQACSIKQENSSAKFRIIDDAGVEVSFDNYSKRIISLAPNITECLFAIGADSLIAGVTDLCDYPPEAKKKPRTGTYFNPNYEVIASLQPDLIIINVENSSNPTYQALKNMGLKLFVSNAKNVKDLFKTISDFGKITGKKDSSDKLNTLLEKKWHDLMSTDSVTKKALILISINPLMTTNGKTFVSEIAELSGFRNIYSAQSLDYPNISYEDVIKKNPEYIIFPTDTNDVDRSNKYTDEITRQLLNTQAVKEKKIILVDENIMFRPGPRIFDAGELIKKKLKGNS